MLTGNHGGKTEMQFSGSRSRLYSSVFLIRPTHHAAGNRVGKEGVSAALSHDGNQPTESTSVAKSNCRRYEQ